MTKNDFVIEKEIRIVGLQRSGNHAIINWIIKQHNCDYIFKNKQRPFCTTINKADFKSERLALYVCSYEDLSIQYAFSRKSFKNRLGPGIVVKKVINILIIRNPFNLFASRIKSKITGIGSKVFNEQDLWKEHAREYLGITDFINGNKILISYDRWFQDPYYRRNVAEELDINFSDHGINEVPTYGGGSSFDMLEYNNKAQEMKVSERWKEFEGNRELEKLLLDSSLLNLYNLIYNEPIISRYAAELKKKSSTVLSLAKDVFFIILLPFLKLRLSIMTKLDSQYE